ncbi:MAG TPA: S41 family peptidase [Candidatus Acidoferrales bacterium]
MVLLCAVLGVSALLGGLLGPSHTTSAATSNDVQDSAKSFTAILATVEANYADPVDADKSIYDGAIPGMLHSLDPHSNFLDPQEYAMFRENQEGRYYGVGMIIQERGNQTMVQAPFDGSPAAKAGVRPGDILASIDGKDCTGLTTTQVADLLKGAKGTTVHVMIKREGWTDLIPMTLTRDEIPRPGVEFYEMIRPGVGYVHVSTFNDQTTDSDLAEALKQLNYPKLDGLVIDLRENGGGLLNQAVGMADMFLEQNELVVSDRGRNSPEERFYAVRGNHGVDVPLVVLVNRDTASASEIVSGAIQDHDRGLIVGETTFGKGLVQREYELSEDTALLLTTARYYTPSGRLIQRNYANSTLYDYLYNRQEPKSPEVKHTDSGRPVYGGGGITPDVVTPATTFTPFQTMLLTRGVLYPSPEGVGDFTRYYLGTKPNVTKDYVADDNAVAQFQKYLDQQHITYTQADIQQNLPWLKWEIKREVFTSIFGLNAGYKVELENDPTLVKGIDSLPQARALYANVKKVLAENRSANPAPQTPNPNQ